MSNALQDDEVPEWTLGWRLRRALDHADMTAEQMADELSVSRQTMSRWMHDRGGPPKPIYLRQWALRCNVSVQWLETGMTTGPTPKGGRAGPRKARKLPRLDSNQEPTDYRRLVPLARAS